MNRMQVLLLLKELISISFCSITDPDDLSGLNTKYLVDQELLLENIEKEISKLDIGDE